jgi:hypothetical protein
MKILSFYLFAIIFGCSPRTATNKESYQIISYPDTTIDWTFDKTQGSQIIFKDRRSFETNLFGLEYIGQIVTEKKSPFLIFSGRDCNACDANISLYIHSPTDGELIVANGQNRYHYPGTEKNYQNDSVVYRARTFYGQVLKGIKGVIWYQDQLDESGKMTHSIYLVHLSDQKRDTSFLDNVSLKETLDYLKQGLCKEIEGHDDTSEP